MADHREWIVSLTAYTEHEYRVLARTAEEAESEAEQLYESGDEGMVLTSTVDEVIAAADNPYAAEELEEDIEFES